MRRAVFFFLAIVLTAGPNALAQTASTPQKPAQAAACPNFVDANGDGVCDNLAARGGRRMGRGMGAGAGRMHAGGAGLAFGRHGESLVAVTARVTGVPAADVTQAVRSGRTFEQIAQDHGKTAQDVVQAALTARQEMVNKAVADGRLTQEQAGQMMERMKSRLEQRVSSAWQPRGRGNGGRCAQGAGVPSVK